MPYITGENHCFSFLDFVTIMIYEIPEIMHITQWVMKEGNSMKRITLGLWIMLVTAGIGIKACEQALEKKDPVLLAEEVALTTPEEKEAFIQKFKKLHTEIVVEQSKRPNKYSDLDKQVSELFGLLEEYDDLISEKEISKKLEEDFERSNREFAELQTNVLRVFLEVDLLLFAKSLNRKEITVQQVIDLLTNQDEKHIAVFFENLPNTLSRMAECIIKTFETMKEMDTKRLMQNDQA
jgi:hypothetical protein